MYNKFFYDKYDIFKKKLNQEKNKNLITGSGVPVLLNNTDNKMVSGSGVITRNVNKYKPIKLKI